MATASEIANRLQNQFGEALTLHEQGHLSLARPLYEEILRTAPNLPDVLDLYGTLLIQLNEPEAALDFLSRAIQHRPDTPGYHNHLGAALRALGRLDEALDSFRRAGEVSPEYPEAYLNQAIVLADLNRFSQALDPSREAVRLRGDDISARTRLGAILSNLGHHDEAEVELDIVLTAEPFNGEAALHRAIGQLARGQPEAALTTARRAILSDPTAYECYSQYRRARVVLEGEPDQIAIAERSRVLQPASALIWANLSAEYWEVYRYEAAIRAAKGALVLEPEYVEAYPNLIAASNMGGAPEQGAKAGIQGLCLGRETARIGFALAHSYFALGRFEDGFKYYEWRLKLDGIPSRIGLPERWDGQRLDDGRLLICSEQGIGDDLLFLSCLPDLVSQVPDPVIEIDTRYAALVERSFPSVDVIGRRLTGADPHSLHYDYAEVVPRFPISQYLLSGDLPGRFRTERSPEQAVRGYLRADPDEIVYWRSRLDALGDEPKVGLCWRGGLVNRTRDQFYTELEGLGPILNLPGLTFVNVQYGECHDELAQVEQRLGIRVHALDGIDLREELDRLAALLSALDLVVSVSSSTAALAGAVGQDTILLARGFLEGPEQPDHFFPSVRPMLTSNRAFDLGLAVKNAAEKIPDILCLSR
ncbi:MAG: tetratricopeptide repeat protein [Rhodospirillaceae bacterium]|nr:tetratricopeptide repeat protein [Rhodospirillaceae bacterium]